MPSKEAITFLADLGVDVFIPRSLTPEVQTTLVVSSGAVLKAAKKILRIFG